MSGYKPYNQTLDTCIYIYGIVGIITLALFGHYIIPHVKPCLFHVVTGYYCPGCGGTRSLIYMLHGHFIKSFLYHPLVPYVAFPGALFIITQTIYRIGRRIHHSSPENINFPVISIRPWYLYTACAVVVVQWIVKNLILLISGYAPI